MSSKQVKYNIEARNGLKAGVDILANSVKVTLGPKGRNVVIEREYAPSIITKDGVTVAREIELEDNLENIGAQLVKDVANKTAEIAGDGTTTSLVLAQIIISEGIKNLASGANPMDLKRGIDKAVAIVIQSLKDQSQQIGDDHDKIKNIATVSANNDETIGELIVEAVTGVGKDGIITIEESKGTDTYVKILDGMQLNRGYVSPNFVTDQEKMEVAFEDCHILLYDKKISVMRELIPILQKQAAEGKPILIISEDLDGEALASLVVNNQRGSLRVAAIKAPGFGENRKDTLQDIAVLTGATVISEERGLKLENAEITHLGTAKKVTINRSKCTIIGPGEQTLKINNRLAQMKSEIANESIGEHEKQLIKERMAKLSGGVAVIYAGAVTEVEMKEKKDRIDDALHATRAAIEEGIVAGGGVAFIRAIESLQDVKGDNDDENTGIQIVRRTIEEPMRQICQNAGIEGSIVVQKVKEGTADFGYNARTDVYENLIAAGVIDPTKVTRVALENAASVASLLITTEAVLVINNKHQYQTQPR
jgi:chaperonin GroEL